MVPTCLLMNLKIEDWRLRLGFRFEHFPEQEISLLVVNRKTKKELTVPCERIDQSLYQAAIHLDDISKHVWDEGTVDFYAACQNPEGDLFKKRIKTEQQPIELSWKSDDQKRVFFLPYTNKKGNFSLKVLHQKAVAEVKDIQLNGDGELLLKGYAFLLNWDEATSVHDRQLVLKEGKEAEERIFKFPLQDIQCEGTDDENVGFLAKIDLKKLYEENVMPALFQFYIEFIGGESETGEKAITRSQPIKLKKKTNQFSILDTANGPARFHIYPQKKKRNMRLRMNDYTLKTRAVYFIAGKRKRLSSSLRKGKNKVKKKIAGQLKRLYYFTFGLAGKLPVKKKTVIFESFAGKQYSCNPRAIYEYMKENNPEYKLYWSVNPEYTDIFEEKGIPYIKRFTLKWLFAMARAEYWVVNSRLPLWIPKPEHTTYLQTWHGTPLKRLAVDMEEVYMPGTNTEKYKKNFTIEASKWDYLISPNAYSTEIFARAFQFNKTMIESGYPRNDFLHTDNNPETVGALKEKMQLPSAKKVIIYAPTWRDDQFYKKGKYKFDLDLDLSKLREEIGDDYVIILRMHYLVAENFDLEPYKGFAYDFSSYEDIRELYMVSDLLITDYSSVFFDFANLKRPMIFFVPDIETYRDKLRGFYFDFEKEAPGPLVKTTDEVIVRIRETEAPDYKLPDIFDPFYKKFCYLETGESSEKVVKTVFK
ncbi:Teichoic acid poly(glycerol phosphate) polymerase [Bacillus paralicheniformis]|uniref:CDP-glycerol glycerophosphotransferase family protein n=1 Tax=Bacillus paralicheniformis TaxID=1648923 RepID=A0AAW6K9Q8_9BACI|nr:MULTISPECIES: CDP-glycerol glycerophosphotransferase family protein [Bacillus]KUL15006.1 CDP-glycerol:glycerophosphate glycerophosphotransferase [Bacillus licheniformis LMG 6934]MDE1383145.1 CDP-glycerol glycerophosphotransferase family protein [Bacillus paralicheniformis]MDE1451269.1 CDP-glycerol glycerophosphotransferase family protein [Bacillus paralicheniformis]MED4308824.1 CDP-glycerol glycerophosphotransferase family protein [Bacillus paralicheniformis]MED4348844.1 CDP-glycerol glycer